MSSFSWPLAGPRPAAVQLVLAVLSGGLLFAAFPPLEWAATAYVALVPLLWLAAQTSPGQAWRSGLLAGLVGWCSSLAWLARVSWVGWLLLGAYCALYLGAFTWLAAWMLPSASRARMGGRLGLLILLPALWVGCEYVRATLFSGFPWNALGASQTLQLPLIQSAAWGGVYAVSYLIVLINTALVLSLLSLSRSAARWSALWPLLLALGVLGLAWQGGRSALRQLDQQPPGAPLALTLVQLNVPQFEKMVLEEGGALIEERLRRITRQSIQDAQPELVVWPETAVPEFVRGTPSTEQLIEDLLQEGVPLLVGAMDYAPTNGTLQYFNSSFLFAPQRGLIGEYRKRHLVVFGETVPLSDSFPFLRRLTPIEESFTAGKSPVVMRLDASARAFAVLICFEDTVAALAREAVAVGARLLINQTNDAWFDPSWASRQHMLQCVWRCVENRVPAARSTNTGVTCCIDRLGRITGLLAPAQGANPEPASVTQIVHLPGPEMPLTFYTRYGDLFAQSCLLSLCWPLLWAGRRRRGSAAAQPEIGG